MYVYIEKQNKIEVFNFHQNIHTKHTCQVSSIATYKTYRQSKIS